MTRVVHADGDVHTRKHVVSGILALALVVACGARADISNESIPGSGLGAADAGFEVSTDGAPLDLCDPDGVRLCGDGCPDLITPDSSTFDIEAGNVCLGYGCLPTKDIQHFTSQSAGVCWADAQSIAKYPCGTCNDGEVCVQKSPSDLVCMPEDVCRALWTLGVRDVCRYADFHPYDGRPVATPAQACPFVAKDGPQRVCSGACPPCPGVERCVGRSPDHPFGLCRDDFVGGLEPQPSAFPPCKTCLATLPSDAGYGCAVFDGSDNAALAHAGGFCMPVKDCLQIGKLFPGGMSCYDGSGNRLGP